MAMEEKAIEKDGRMVGNGHVSSSIIASTLPPRKKSKMNTMRWLILFFYRGRTTTKKTATVGLDYDITQSGKKGLFRKILCAIRPLYHLEENSIATPSSQEKARQPVTMIVKERKSPYASFSSDRLSSDGTSHYGSVEDLRGLDTSMNAIAGEGMVEQENNNGGAPHDIDLQAEEFIARFYEQMKLQSMNNSAHKPYL